MVDVGAGVFAAATVMSAYKVAQGIWGRLGKRKPPSDSENNPQTQDKEGTE